MAGAGRPLPMHAVLEAGVRGVVRAESCTGPGLAAAVHAAARGHLFVQDDLVDQLRERHEPLRSAAPDRPDLACLTGREREVMRLLASGRSNRQLAAALHISERTVRFHLANIFTKLGVRSRGEAIGLVCRIDVA